MDACRKKTLGDPKNCFTFRTIDVRKASVQWPLLENFVPKVFRTNLIISKKSEKSNKVGM